MCKGEEGEERFVCLSLGKPWVFARSLFKHWMEKLRGCGALLTFYVSRGQASSKGGWKRRREGSQWRAWEPDNGGSSGQERTTKRVAANRIHNDRQGKKKEKREKKRKKEELVANVKVSDGGWSGNASLLQQGRTVGMAYHIVWYVTIVQPSHKDSENNNRIWG